MADLKKCLECDSSNLIYDEARGEVICSSCGLLIEEKMVDTSHELRSFDKSEKKSRKIDLSFRVKKLSPINTIEGPRAPFLTDDLIFLRNFRC